MFIRKKNIKGKTYYQVVRTYRDGYRVRQELVVSLGRSPTPLVAIDKLLADISTLQQELKVITADRYTSKMAERRCTDLEGRIARYKEKIRLLKSLPEEVQNGSTSNIRNRKAPAAAKPAPQSPAPRPQDWREIEPPARPSPAPPPPPQQRPEPPVRPIPEPRMSAEDFTDPFVSEPQREPPQPEQTQAARGVNPEADNDDVQRVLKIISGSKRPQPTLPPQQRPHARPGYSRRSDEESGILQRLKRR